MSVSTFNQPALRSLPHANREVFFEAAQDNMEAYGGVPYEIGKTIVDQVVDEETRGMAYSVRPDFIDSGSDAAAFRVKPEGSEEVDVLTAAFNPAVKFDHPSGVKKALEETGNRLEALWRARKVPGHVKLRAADREKGLVITTEASGKGISSYDEPIEPTDEHWKQLKRTARGMRRNRVGFDKEGGNINWDPKTGFEVYDTRPVGFNPRKWVRPRRFMKDVKQSVQRHNDSRRLTDWI